MAPAGAQLGSRSEEAAAALSKLEEIERSAESIGNDAAALLTGLQSALQTVRKRGSRELHLQNPWRSAFTTHGVLRH